MNEIQNKYLEINAKYFEDLKPIQEAHRGALRALQASCALNGGHPNKTTEFRERWDEGVGDTFRWVSVDCPDCGWGFTAYDDEDQYWELVEAHG